MDEIEAIHTKKSHLAAATGEEERPINDTFPNTPSQPREETPSSSHDQQSSLPSAYTFSDSPVLHSAGLQAEKDFARDQAPLFHQAEVLLKQAEESARCSELKNAEAAVAFSEWTNHLQKAQRERCAAYQLMQQADCHIDHIHMLLDMQECLRFKEEEGEERRKEEEEAKLSSSSQQQQQQQQPRNTKNIENKVQQLSLDTQVHHLKASASKLESQSRSLLESAKQDMQQVESQKSQIQQLEEALHILKSSFSNARLNLSALEERLNKARNHLRVFVERTDIKSRSARNVIQAAMEAMTELEHAETVLAQYVVVEKEGEHKETGHMIEKRGASASCGGDNDDPTSPPPTPASQLSRANTIEAGEGEGRDEEGEKQKALERSGNAGSICMTELPSDISTTITAAVQHSREGGSIGTENINEREILEKIMEDIRKHQTSTASLLSHARQHAQRATEAEASVKQHSELVSRIIQDAKAAQAKESEALKMVHDLSTIIEEQTGAKLTDQWKRALVKLGREGKEGWIEKEEEEAGTTVHWLQDLRDSIANMRCEG